MFKLLDIFIYEKKILNIEKTTIVTEEFYVFSSQIYSPFYLYGKSDVKINEPFPTEAAVIISC